MYGIETTNKNHTNTVTDMVGQGSATTNMKIRHTHASSIDDKINEISDIKQHNVTTEFFSQGSALKEQKDQLNQRGSLGLEDTISNLKSLTANEKIVNAFMKEPEKLNATHQVKDDMAPVSLKIHLKNTSFYPVDDFTFGGKAEKYIHSEALGFDNQILKDENTAMLSSNESFQEKNNDTERKPSLEFDKALIETFEKSSSRHENSTKFKFSPLPMVDKGNYVIQQLESGKILVTLQNSKGETQTFFGKNGDNSLKSNNTGIVHQNITNILNNTENVAKSETHHNHSEMSLDEFEKTGRNTTVQSTNLQTNRPQNHEMTIQNKTNEPIYQDTHRGLLDQHDLTESNHNVTMTEFTIHNLTNHIINESVGTNQSTNPLTDHVIADNINTGFHSTNQPFHMKTWDPKSSTFEQALKGSETNSYIQNPVFVDKPTQFYENPLKHGERIVITDDKDKDSNFIRLYLADSVNPGFKKRFVAPNNRKTININQLRNDQTSYVLGTQYEPAYSYEDNRHRMEQSRKRTESDQPQDSIKYTEQVISYEKNPNTDNQSEQNNENENDASNQNRNEATNSHSASLNEVQSETQNGKGNIQTDAEEAKHANKMNESGFNQGERQENIQYGQQKMASQYNIEKDAFLHHNNNDAHASDEHGHQSVQLLHSSNKDNENMLKGIFGEYLLSNNLYHHSLNLSNTITSYS